MQPPHPQHLQQAFVGGSIKPRCLTSKNNDEVGCCKLAGSSTCCSTHITTRSLSLRGQQVVFPCDSHTTTITTTCHSSSPSSNEERVGIDEGKVVEARGCDVRRSRPNLVALVLGCLRQGFASSQHANSGGRLVRWLFRLWVFGPSTFWPSRSGVGRARLRQAGRPSTGDSTCGNHST